MDGYAPPLDWTQSALNDLLRILADAYPRVPALERIARNAGLPTADLPTTGTARDRWHAVFDSLAARGRLRAMVDARLSDPDVEAYWPALRAAAQALAARRPRQTIARPTRGHSRKALRELLISLFERQMPLYIFIADLEHDGLVDALPSVQVSMEEFAFGAVGVLARFGLIDDPLFDALAAKFPHREADIVAVLTAETDSRAPNARGAATIAQTHWTGRRRAVIVVPGLLGSELWNGDDRIFPADELNDWADLAGLADASLRVGGVVRTLGRVATLGAPHDLWAAFSRGAEALGYREGENLFFFPWDWRGDVRVGAAALRRFIAERRAALAADDELLVLGFSQGSLVARWCVDHLGGAEDVARLLLVASSDRGSPFVIGTLARGWVEVDAPNADGPVERRLARHASGVLRQLPGVYQSLPLEPCIRGPQGRVNHFIDTGWLGPAPHRHDYLADALALQQALAGAPTVPTCYVYGTGQPTPEEFLVNRGADGQPDWESWTVNWGDGDGHILARTARPTDLAAGVEIRWQRQVHDALPSEAGLLRVLDEFSRIE